VCRIGGITPWLEVAAIADAFNLRVCPHCGDLMQVHQHLVKAVTNNWMLEVIPLWDEGPFVDQVQLRDGICETPTAPGASTEIKPSALEEFRVG
jgi:L-alanine-DL-glutamate epimerase-like enolase superfamily enzyme